ncbi:MAG TPA: hypothetical protein VMV60_11490 [Thermoanaerobaculia bacterium]|nr:hypothetical protein [Thermoanaerobaculia bacterium]
MRKTVFAAALILVSALPAAGQLGPWGPPAGGGVPAWVDWNDNGAVDFGETTMYPELIQVFPLPVPPPPPEDQIYVQLHGNPWDPGNTYDNRINAYPLLNPTTVTRRHLSNNPNGVSETLTFTGAPNTYVFHFVETYNPPPGVRSGRRSLGTATGALGDGALLDTNGDGVYDTLQISGSHGAVNVPVTNISLVFKDVNGDGKADYVSIDWLLSGLLGVKTGDHQVWLPLTADSGGHPNTVTVKMPDPSNPGSFGGIDVPVPIVPQADGGPSPMGTPALSGIGLLALSAALAAGGVLLVRGRIFV